MPERSHKTTATTQEPTSTTSLEPTTSQDGVQQTHGNSFVQSQLKGEGAYSDFLGRTLGPKVYSQVSGEIDDAALIKQAGSAVDSAIKVLKGYLENKVDPDQQEAANQFYQALDKAITDLAKQAIVEGGVGGSLRHFVDTNPELVTSALVAGAVAYIATNQELPTLSHTFQASNTSDVSVGIDLGRTLDIAIERIEMKYRYTGDGNSFQVLGKTDPSQGTWDVEGTFQKDLATGGNLQLSALQAVSNSQTQQRIGLDYTNQPWAASAAFERTREQDGPMVDAISGALSYNNDNWAAHARGTTRSDDSWDASMGLSNTQGNRTWGVEGYGSQTPGAKQTDYGGRVFFSLKF